MSLSVLASRRVSAALAPHSRCVSSKGWGGWTKKEYNDLEQLDREENILPVRADRE